MMKKQIGVIFGSRSCEREVSIISAVQMMRYINREKYDVIPVYIDEKGQWYTGEKLMDINSFKPFNPEKGGFLKVFPDLTSGSGALLTIKKSNGESTFNVWNGSRPKHIPVREVGNAPILPDQDRQMG